LSASNGLLLWSRTWVAKTWGLVHVEAINPATGATLWNNSLHAGYGAGAYPTAANRELYVRPRQLARQPAVRAEAVRRHRALACAVAHSGDNSTPTLDGSTVYVWLAGPQTYAFDRATGTECRHYSGCCTGGGGSMTMLFDGRFMPRTV
jgi:outer membrane protein assembly factor BamB